MLSTVFAKTLRDQRKALAWWGLGVVGTVLMYAGFWPNVRDNAGQFQEYLESLPEAIRSLMGDDFTTPAGYLQAELFSLMGPILLMVYAIGAGSRAIAGEEEAGTLDLLLSTPVTRRRVLLDKFGSMVGATFLLAALIWGSVLLLGAPFDLRPDLANLSSATANLFLLGLSFGSLPWPLGRPPAARDWPWRSRADWRWSRSS